MPPKPECPKVICIMSDGPVAFGVGLFFMFFFVAAAARLALKKFVALVRSRKPFRAFGHNLSVAIVARSQMELSEEIASPKKKEPSETLGECRLLFCILYDWALAEFCFPSASSSDTKPCFLKPRGDGSVMLAPSF